MLVVRILEIVKYSNFCKLSGSTTPAETNTQSWSVKAKAILQINQQITGWSRVDIGIYIFYRQNSGERKKAAEDVNPAMDEAADRQVRSAPSDHYWQTSNIQTSPGPDGSTDHSLVTREGTELNWSVFLFFLNGKFFDIKYWLDWLYLFRLVFV